MLYIQLYTYIYIMCMHISHISIIDIQKYRFIYIYTYVYKCDRLISLVLKYECYECIRLPQLGLRGPSASEPSTSRRTSLRLGCCSGDLYMGCRPKPWYPSDLKIGKWMTLPKKQLGLLVLTHCTDCARLGSTIVSSLTAGYFW